MTVPANLNRVDYTGTGSTGPFTVPFPFYDASHLTVLQTDALFNQTTLTGWTATGAGGPSGAVTLAAACPVGSTLTIMRLVPLTQITSIKNQEAFYPEVHEQEMDLLAMADQQLDEAMDRTLRLPAGLSGVDMTLPKPDPGHSLVWNAGGTALVNGAVASADLQTDLADSADVAKGDEMIAVKQPFTGAVARTQHDINTEWVSVLDFGADPTGEFDSSLAIQAAIQNAHTNHKNKVVYFPMGTYKCETEIELKVNVSLIGAEGRCHQLWFEYGNPKMPILYFPNDTNGIVVKYNFFKNQIKNIAIWSGVSVGNSTKTGLRLWTERTDLNSTTNWEGLGNVYENVHIEGFKLGIKIAGAYSWYQHFSKIQCHNCESGIDIECQSFNGSVFDTIYIVCDTGAWSQVNRRGIVLRSGGRVHVNNSILEVLGIGFELDDVTTTDLVTRPESRQFIINDCYTEAMLLATCAAKVSGYYSISNMRISYGWYSSYTNAFWINATSTPSDGKITIIANNILVMGVASPDNRRIRKLFSSNSNVPASKYHVELTNVDATRNDFETLWEVNYPPNKLTFLYNDDANNKVEFFQGSTTTTRAYAVIENEKGNIPSNSLKWTNHFGNVLDVNTLYAQLGTDAPIRVRQDQKLKRLLYDNQTNINGTTKSSNDYSGIRYVNYTGADVAIAFTVDFSISPYGTEFYIGDTPGAAKKTSSTVTVGSQTISVGIGEFVIIRKVLQTGASIDARFIVVARGAV